MTDRKIKYWMLTPVREPDPTKGPYMATAAVVTCMATGETLDSAGGGGGPYLSNYIVDALDMRKQGYKPRVIGDAEDFEALMAIAEEAAKIQDPSLSVLASRAAEVIARIATEEPGENPDHTPE